MPLRLSTNRANKAPSSVRPHRNNNNNGILEKRRVRLMLFGIPWVLVIMFNLPMLSEYHQQQLPMALSAPSFGILPTILTDAMPNTPSSGSKNIDDINTNSLFSVSRKNVTVAVCREDMGLDIGGVYRGLLPYLFPSDLYRTRVVETDKARLPANESTADVLLCLGYFYSQNYTMEKLEIGKKFGHLSIDHGRNVTKSLTDVYWPPKTTIVPHRGGRPFQFSFQSEAWDLGNCRFDLMIVSTDPKRDLFRGCPLYFWPYYATSFFRREGWPQLLSKLQYPPNTTQAAAILRSKTDFCAFVVSSCWDSKYRNNDIMVRPTFYDVLSERMRTERRRMDNTNQTSNEKTDERKKQAIIKSYGKCRNTEGGALVHKNGGGYYRDTDDVVAMYRKFRFALVFENNAVPGYVTEKIMNALLADTIPIFWGTPDIAKYVNMDRIVHCDIEGSEGLKKFRTLPKPTNLKDAESMIKTYGHSILKDAFASCIDEIVELEQNPEKYIWKLSQPILPGHGKVEGSYFDLEKVGREMRTVISAFDSPLVSLDHSDPTFDRTITIAS